MCEKQDPNWCRFCTICPSLCRPLCTTQVAGRRRKFIPNMKDLWWQRLGRAAQFWGHRGEPCPVHPWVPWVTVASAGGTLVVHIRIQHQGWEDHVRSAYSPFSPWIPEIRNTICTNPQYCQPLIPKQELGTSVCPLGEFLLGNQCPHLRCAALACVFYRAYFSSPSSPLREYSTVHAFGIRWNV